MHEWLEGARDRMAAQAGLGTADLSLTDDEIEALLELARVVAHESGDRTNAPLACYLAGVVMGRNHALDLARLAHAATEHPG